MVPGWQRGRAIAVVLAGITVASKPGIVAVLVVTLLLLTGHQAIYTYVAPFALRSGFGRTSLVLLVFGSPRWPGYGSPASSRTDTSGRCSWPP